MIKRLFYYFISCVVIFFIGCSERKNTEHQIQVDKPHSLPKDLMEDSLTFFSKFKKLRPAFNLQVDTAYQYRSRYQKTIDIDTNNCSSFRLNRVFIGRVKDLLMSVRFVNRENTFTKYLQSGNLKLWVCNLPDNIKDSDKFLITADIYDIMGFEKVFGYPTIIRELYKK
jgi:hypothetical protein